MEPSAIIALSLLAGILVILILADPLTSLMVKKNRKKRLRRYYHKYTEWKAENRRRELMRELTGNVKKYPLLPPPAEYPYF